jgi:integrase
MEIHKDAKGIYWTRFWSPPNKHGHKRKLFVKCRPEYNSKLALTRMAQEMAKRYVEGMFIKDTLADYVRDRFLPEHSAAENLSKSTRALYEYMFERIVLPELGRLPLTAIDVPTVNRFVDTLQKQTKTTKGSRAGGTSSKAKADRAPSGVTTRRYSDQTIRNVVVAIVTVLRYAKRVKDLAEIPEITPPKVVKTKEAVIYTREETQLLVRQARDQEEHAALMLMVDAGMRASEILGLTYEQIDYRDHVITISQQLYRDQGLRAPKSGKARKAPMSVDLESALKKIRGFGRGFVFQDAMGRPRTHGWLRHVFQTARRAANLPPARLHDSRHTFSSRKVAEGVNPFELKELLGHADIRTTQGYVHVVAPQPRSVLEPAPTAASTT